VEYEDRLTIATPEGVELELTLAGVGSRFTSAIVDFVIQLTLLGALGVAFVVAGLGGDAGLGAFALLSFVLFAGYDVLFEVLASGRTPGKRLNGLRVVRSDGAAVGFLTSAIRNSLRLVDILPGWYLVGIVTILATRRNQRLGDLAADTIVVRDRRLPRRANADVRARPSVETLAWDASAVTREELLAVRRFLDRRGDLGDEARRRLASELAWGLRAKVAGAPRELGDEAFLERLAAVKAARG
jgi:uncharacterized RDD family membrane protein YckC